LQYAGFRRGSHQWNTPDQAVAADSRTIGLDFDGARGVCPTG
jgi:hypothetical protein